MANLYATTDDYQLIYNPAVSCDFSGYMQSVGGNTITCKIADSLPADDVDSFDIEVGDFVETILSGVYIRIDGLVNATLNTGLQLYAKTASGDGTLSLVSPIDISVGGTAVSSSNPLPVGGKSLTSTCTFTRPADTTAYSINDVIADRTSDPTAPFSV
jgi:hypothetical protein